MAVKNPFEGRVKTLEGNYIKYQIHPECPVCQAVDPKSKKKLRLDADKMFIDGSTTKEISVWLRDNFAIDISAYRVNTHITKHSEYIGKVEKEITDMVKDKRIEQISTIVDEYIPAEEVLGDIITKGGQKIKTGEINVDGKLLLGAIKEEGSRKKTGTLTELWEKANKQRFLEGEIVDDE